ncbi:3-hydroxyacyl-ACP dehydratase FabZ family protein [Poriferisphaera sp. WC338]|uniref:3-hydroxyacyl-ACP dehydratase FabZ family protein n=1 Tax=Poriferisphaera sp. WC338 TaxID=3425129 RepID=UPI003D816CDE
MAPQLLYDISDIDLSQVVRDVDFIENVNPHRGHMRLLDAIVYENFDEGKVVARKDVRDDEFWVEGHIPGRPIFPGVLMIEAAAQLSSYTCLSKMPGQHFMGFAGVDGVKFRGQVAPGDTIYLLVKETDFRRKRCVCQVQGLVNGKLVFEATITGMPM